MRYEFDAARIFTKGMHDMADAQTGEGLVPNIAPEFTQFEGTFRAAAEWGAAFIVVPWQQYQFAGDRELLRTHYDAMKRYFAYLETRAEGDILTDGLGDWYDLGPARPGNAQLTPPPGHRHGLLLPGRAALVADRAKCSASSTTRGPTQARAEQIRASYNRHFFDAEKGSYATGSQCANALPLVMGMVDPAERERVFAALVRDVESRGGAMTAGDVGFRYLLQALAQGNRSDLIYRMINQDDKPGYGYQLKTRRHQPDRILGRQPRGLAQPLHARPHHRVVLQGPRGHRGRSRGPRILENHRQAAARGRPDLGRRQLRIDPRTNRSALGALRRALHAASDDTGQHDGHRFRTRPSRKQRSGGRPGG